MTKQNLWGRLNGSYTKYPSKTSCSKKSSITIFLLGKRYIAFLDHHIENAEHRYSITIQTYNMIELEIILYNEKSHVPV